LQEVGDFCVAELFEFPEHDDFAVEGVEFLDRAADPQAGFRCIVFRWIGSRVAVTQKSGAKGRLAAVGTENLKADGVEISAEEGARFMAR